MGKISKILIDRWDGGVKNDSRDPAENTCTALVNFDAISNKKKLVPYRSSEGGDSGSATAQKQNFVVALRSGTTYNIFSLGRQVSLNRAEVLMKTISTGGSSDLGDNGWTTPNYNESSTASPNYNLFVYYRKRNRIFGAEAGTRIFTFDPSSAATWDDEGRNLTYTNIAQGLVHSKDDILYIPYDNKIAKNDNNTWTDAALTFPAHFKINSISEYGNFIAIAAVPLAGVGNSVVYLWDRDVSLVTLSEAINWGEGELKVLEQVNGELLGISLLAGNAALTEKVVFKRLISAQQIEVIEELSNESGGAVVELPIAKQVINNRLHFLMQIRKNSEVQDGVWSIGRNSVGQFSIIRERSPENDTAIGGGIADLKNFFYVRDYLFISYLDSTDAFALSKTDNASSYSHTSFYETKKFNLEDIDKIKKLIGASLMFEALPANGIVRLFYRKDEETSWTRIFTYGTDNGISHGANQIEIGSDTVTMTIASPAVVTLANHDLVAGQEIKFRTTGALPTGVTAGTTYYVISTGLATDTFRFSATSGGAAVNTSGSQSGVHTMERDFPLPEFKEIQFKIESTGGAEITGLKFKAEEIDKEVY